MQRILLVETASPERVLKKAEEMAAGGTHGQAEITILCKDEERSVRVLGAVEGARLIRLERRSRKETLERLSQSRFDVVYAFWTGDKRCLRMKLDALRITATLRQIDIGDGHVFQISPGNLFRFLLIRWRYPLPSDHYQYVSREPEKGASAMEPVSSAPEPELHHGERILVIQSAEPAVIAQAMDRLREKPLFRDPRYVVFCRDDPAAVRLFGNNPGFAQVITHSETRGTLSHLARLRRERFDSVVIFFTGDPSYWKIKYLPFLLGARHKVVFNENGDCFFFSWKAWFSHVTHRLARSSVNGARPRWTGRVRGLAMMATKATLLPFRFLWLLLVWLRLRSSSLRLSG